MRVDVFKATAIDHSAISPREIASEFGRFRLDERLAALCHRMCNGHTFGEARSVHCIVRLAGLRLKRAAYSTSRGRARRAMPGKHHECITPHPPPHHYSPARDSARPTCT